MIDEHAIRELELFMENDREIYRQTQAIEQNLAKKQKSGKYDHKLAPKLWQYAVDRAATKYVKEFDARGARVQDVFPKPLREALAKKLADYYLQNGPTSGLGLLPGIPLVPIAAGIIGYLIGRKAR